MAASQDPETPGLDALRLRLYRPGASESDLERYLAERSSVTPEPAVEVDRPRVRARLLRLLPAAALAALAVVAFAGALTQLHPPHPAPAASAARTVSPALIRVQDIGDGTLLTVRQRTPIRSDAAPVSVDGAAVVGQRFEGSGNAVLSVDPPSGSTRGGNATVVLTSGGPVPVAWRALSFVDLGQWTAVPVVLARGTSAEPAGAIAPQTFRYRDAPPTRIAVIAPEGVRWSVLVGLSGPTRGLHRAGPHAPSARAVIMSGPTRRRGRSNGGGPT